MLMKQAISIPEPGSISFEERVTMAKPYDWGYGSTRRSAQLRTACAGKRRS